MLIEGSTTLQHLNIDQINLRNRVLLIMWPLVRSKSLQSIHISNNDIPDTKVQTLLAVFQIKTFDGDLFDQGKSQKFSGY